MTKPLPPRTITLPIPPWDLGASGQANRAGLIMEDAAEIDPATGERVNPNGVKRVRRIDMIEIWHRSGVLPTRAYNAAVAFRGALETTMREKGWPDTEKVDGSPKPDTAVAIKVDAAAALAAMTKGMSQPDRRIIEWCVLIKVGPNGERYGSPTPSGLKEYRGQNYRRGLVALREALERLADRIEGRK